MALKVQDNRTAACIYFQENLENYELTLTRHWFDSHLLTKETAFLPQHPEAQSSLTVLVMKDPENWKMSPCWQITLLSTTCKLLLGLLTVIVSTHIGQEALPFSFPRNHWVRGTAQCYSEDLYQDLNGNVEDTLGGHFRENCKVDVQTKVMFCYVAVL